MQELLEIFREEGQERLGRVARAVEGLADATTDKTSLMDEIDRELHTLKGSARMLGYSALGRLVHETETLARVMRKGTAAAGARELLVEVADRLTALVLSCAGTGEDAGDEVLEGRIRAASGSSGSTAKPKPRAGTTLLGGTVAAAPPPEVPPPAVTPAPPVPTAAPTAAVEPPPPGFEPLLPPKTGLWRLPRKEQKTGEAPPPKSDPDEATTTWKVSPRTDGPAPITRKVAKEIVARVETGKALPLPPPRPAPPPTAPTEKEAALPAGNVTGSGVRAEPAPEEIDLVRVRASKLGQLDGFVSELSLARLRLDAFEESLRALASDLDARATDPAGAANLVRRMGRRFREDRVHLSRVSKGLERLAIDVRLRPVARVFDPLPREARELARRLGKKARVRIRGAETELDRAILDGVRDPLLHILRNTIDHGIEPPAERIALGKSEEGQLDVEASQDGGSVLIRVRDDGRGIDPEKVRAAAVKKRVVSEEQAARLSSDEAVNLIFVPGFSTKDTVNEISGRGVGMDIVKKNVELLKGEVRIRSVVGQGTEITLRLPLTALVSRVLFFRIGSTLMGIPTSAVMATAIVGASEVGHFNGRPTIKHRGRSVPVAWLADLLGLDGGSETERGTAHRLAIVHHNDDVLALVVTVFEGERSVVVKPLGWPLEHIRGTAGAVHLGTGDTALLLHVPDLLAFSHESVGNPQATMPKNVAPPPRLTRKVLIVDDSVITRQLERRILEGLGFEVELAVDGQDALRILERTVPDLIITDVEMPRLDGLGLARRIRKEPRTREIPIVIVSTRGGDADKQAGLEAGADGYIVKSAFDEKTLRDIIDRFL
jgi:chemotaxis protein histidine kinase CheA/CheY-like chemotaxis protein